MRLRLLALSLAGAAAFAMPATANASGTIEYTRECGGTVDVMCKEYSCRFVDCFWFNCTVYVDPLHNGLTVCV